MTMDKENMEWPEDGKLLAQVDNSNPFAVPAGYFEGLDERILAAVKIDEIKNTLSAGDFLVPDDYFDDLSDNIQSRIAVEETLQKQDAAFEVPDNYFENLSANIQSRIAVEEALSKGTAFEVPADYFESLSSQIQSRVFVEETLMAADAFTVPEDYFEQLNNRILNQTIKQEAVKPKGTVIQMIRSTAFKYATAACFVLVVGASLLLWPSQNVDTHQSSFLHQKLSDIPIDDIQGYVELNVDASDTQHTVATQNVSLNDDELEAALANYVENTK